jgi:DNA-binding NtrC family response regulator
MSEAAYNIPAGTNEQRTGGGHRILVIDDDFGLAETVEMLLRLEGYDPVVANDAGKGLELARECYFELVITDLKLPDSTGLDVIQTIHETDPETPVILMTSFSSVESAVEALRLGAVDYIIKPFNNDKFLHAVGRALDERRIKRENRLLKRNLGKVYDHKKLIGESESIRRVLDLIERVAPSDANVLIQGESGTGKELVARAIHDASNRANGPFVPINCGAIPADLLESELFGHVKGAYTGAVASSEGLIREAKGGTLLLDEISELAISLQVKLLRVIQERQVRPVGSSQFYNFDVRFLAATNKDLREEVEKGNFREDLFYRLNVINIHVPPLRERPGDVEVLARRFIAYHSKKIGKRVKGISKDFAELLNKQQWPGNVRELENLIERAVILAEGDTLTRRDIVDMMPQAPRRKEMVDNDTFRALSVEEYIREIIVRYQDQYSETDLAKMLGIGRKALWTRRRNWGLHRSKGPADRDSDADDDHDDSYSD